MLRSILTRLLQLNQLLVTRFTTFLVAAFEFSKTRASVPLIRRLQLRISLGFVLCFQNLVDELAQTSR
ncbi:MAG: hypothetical protein ACKOI2_04065, partial [Actinomycetota bacterium]